MNSNVNTVAIQKVEKEVNIDETSTTIQSRQQLRSTFEIDDEDFYKVKKVEIIDMQRTKTKDIPLSNLLSEISLERRKEKSLLHQKEFQLESNLKALKRNLEEVERERNKMEILKQENELKLEIKRFLAVSFDDIDVFCEEISKLIIKSKSFDKVPSSLELINNSILSVVVPIYNEKLVESDKDIIESDELLNFTRKLKITLPEEIYLQIIYHVWWPVARQPHFTTPIDDFEGWRGVIRILEKWILLLPENFLKTFIGNQILIPRLHSLLQCINPQYTYSDAENKNSCNVIVAEVWGILKFKIKLPEEVLEITLKVEILNWLKQRILTVSLKQFEGLVEEFDLIWQKGKCDRFKQIKRIELDNQTAETSSKRFNY